MSRIGKAPVSITKGVEVKIVENTVIVKGPKGELSQELKNDISVSVEDDNIIVTRPNESKESKSLHGLYRALLANMIEGVTLGFQTKQELVGVGYRANLTGQVLELSLGFSHGIQIKLPTEIKAEVVADKGKNPVVILNSHDKQLLGHVAAKIRSFRVPEPYKGKGIKFVGEDIRRKAGKSAGKK
jgi:large subunit ribosomal protein L6